MKHLPPHGPSGEAPTNFPDLPCNAPDFANNTGLVTASYTKTGLPTEVIQTLVLSNQSYDRSQNAGYDAFGRSLFRERVSNEVQINGASVIRRFDFSYDDANGTYTRVGPDGVVTVVEVDVAGRVESVRRGPVGSPLMSAVYSYFDDDVVQSIAYGNGASVWYTYDAARRVVRIEHRDGLGTTLLRMDYAYTDNDLPATITERDALGVVATVNFTYDNRNRLIREVRIGPSAYDLAYTYDLGGNRLTKTDALNQVLVMYHYDIDDPTLYNSDNNRLMYYETYDTSTGAMLLSSPSGKRGFASRGVRANASSPSDRTSTAAGLTLLSTTWYYYTEHGNVSRIVTEQASAPGMYSADRFVYARNGQAVTYLLKETWAVDPNSSCTLDYDIVTAREFRYDGFPRAVPGSTA